MIIIALTGSLATGKSTVSRLLSQPPYSLPIIDADLLARQVVEPGTPGYQKVLSYFGPSMPDLLLPADDPPSTGQERSEKESTEDHHQRRRQARPINRAALGRRVFGTSPSRIRDRQALNSIIHPLVRRAMLMAVLYYHFRGHWACILDVPLLYESRLDIFASVVFMVAVRDPVVQMRRLRERDRALSRQEAEDRVRSQMGVLEKVGKTLARGKRRGKVLWNDGAKGELEGEVERVIREIREEGWGAWWRWWLWGSPLGLVVCVVWEIGRAWVARRWWEMGEGRKKVS